MRARRRQTGEGPAQTRQRIQAPRNTDGNALHSTLRGHAPRDPGNGMSSGDANPLDGAGTRARAPDALVVLANVNRDCGITGEQGRIARVITNLFKASWRGTHRAHTADDPKAPPEYPVLPPPQGRKREPVLVDDAIHAPPPLADT